MNLQQLEYIIAVNEKRNFGKAAESCFVTQPTLSMMIRKLEEELNVKIFDRTQQPVRPTEIGELIIKQAKSILREVNQLKDLILQEKQSLSGSLHIGIIPTIAPYLVPLFLKSFLDKYPDIELSITELMTHKLIDKLVSREIDVGIFVPPAKTPLLVHQTLFYEEFYVYSSHFFEKEYLLPKDIDPEKLWLLQEGHCFRSQTINLCELQELSESRLKYEIGSLETLKNLVDHYNGITLLPELASFTLSAEQASRLKQFQSPPPVREVCLFTHRDFYRKTLLKKLKDEILLFLPERVKNKIQYQTVEIGS